MATQKRFLAKNGLDNNSLTITNVADPVNVTDVANKQFVTTTVGAKANIASPTFTGTPAAPTATAGTNTTQLATTAFVLANAPASSTVVSTAFTIPASITPSANILVSMTGTVLLNNATISSFEVTSWNGTVTNVAATANAATFNIAASATIGQVLTISVVAIDNYGNRSSSVSHTTTVTAHAAPTGTITINKPTSVMQSSTGNQISFTGGTAYDGATITYQINASGNPQYTFSKTSNIASGEVVTFTAPSVGSDTTINFTVQMNDSLGASSSPQATSIQTIIANITGVVLLTTGADGGGWAHIDASGNTITSPTAVTNNNIDCSSNPSFAGNSVFTLTDVTIDGQAMVRVPKFYYKTAVIASGANAGKTAWWVSDVAIAGFTIHPAFMSGGVEIAQFYYGKYQARMDGSKLGSLSGGLPAVSRSLTQFLADANARNVSGVTGFQLHSFWQWSAIQWLYLIENKTANSQTKSGAGNTSSSAAVNVESAAAIYRGIVGLWGNVWQWMDGFKSDASNIIQTWDTNGNKTWVSSGVSGANLNGTYPLTINTTSTLAPAFIAATLTSTSTSATFPDYQYCSANNYPFTGGHWASGSNGGLWSLNCSGGASVSNTYLGARLAKV